MFLRNWIFEKLSPSMNWGGYKSDEKGKLINVYCDNGGSFYKYKINKTFDECVY